MQQQVTEEDPLPSLEEEEDLHSLRMELVEEARQQVQLLESLVKCPGWDELVRVIKAMMEINIVKLTTEPAMSMDSIVAQEFLKGEVAGWRRVMELPEELIDSSGSVVEEHKRRRAEEREDGDE